MVGSARRVPRACEHFGFKTLRTPILLRLHVCDGYYLHMLADTQSHRCAPTSEQVDLAVEVFRMLSDSTRVRLLWALLDGERPVNELAETVGKSPTGVSQHLAKLRMARLVRTRK